MAYFGDFTRKRGLPITVSSSLPESAWGMRDTFSKVFSASHLLDDIHDPVQS